MLLNKAIAIAAIAHDGQLDKGGEPYIFHPMRVAQSLPHTTERIVAMLHDVVEDSDITIADLREIFPIHIIEAVDVLTRHPKEAYQDYIKRIAKNPLAREVKLADLEDNMRLSRLPQPITAKEIDRWKKYRIAKAYLNWSKTCS